MGKLPRNNFKEADLSKVRSLSGLFQRNGVKAAFVADKDHRSLANKQQMAGFIGAYNPDLLLLEIGAERRDVIYNNPSKLKGGNNELFLNAIDTTHTKIIAVDSWSEEKKQQLSNMQERQSNAKDENMRLNQQRIKALMDGNVDKAEKINTRMGKSLAIFTDLLPKVDEILTERVNAETNDAIAENAAREIVAFYHANHRMPTFAFKFGAEHFAKKYDINEMLIDKLKTRGLPVEQYRTSQVVEFWPGKEEGAGVSVKMVGGEYNFRVTVNSEKAQR